MGYLIANRETLKTKIIHFTQKSKIHTLDRQLLKRSFCFFLHPNWLTVKNHMLPFGRAGQLKKSISCKHITLRWKEWTKKLLIPWQLQCFSTAIYSHIQCHWNENIPNSLAEDETKQLRYGFFILYFESHTEKKPTTTLA